MFLPKDTPQDIVDTYRDTARKVVKAPGFKEKAAEQIGDYDQIVGDSVDLAVKMIFSLSDDDKKWIQNWITTKYGVKF